VIALYIAHANAFRQFCAATLFARARTCGISGPRSTFAICARFFFLHICSRIESLLFGVGFFLFSPPPSLGIAGYNRLISSVFDLSIAWFISFSLKTFSPRPLNSSAVWVLI